LWCISKLNKLQLLLFCNRPFWLAHHQKILKLRAPHPQNRSVTFITILHSCIKLYKYYFDTYIILHGRKWIYTVLHLHVMFNVFFLVKFHQNTNLFLRLWPLQRILNLFEKNCQKVQGFWTRFPKFKVHAPASC